MGEVGNPKCGDIMRMYLKIENNVIVDVKFLTFGCGGRHRHQQHGHRPHQGQDHRRGAQADQQGCCGSSGRSAPIKVHCSVLAEQAVKAALSDYYRRQGIDPEPIVGKLEEDCDHCESCGH